MLWPLWINKHWYHFSNECLFLRITSAVKKLKSELHELHGKVCVKTLYLLEVMGRCGCCQEQELAWRYCWFSCPGAVLLARERTLPKPSCLQGWRLCYAQSNRLHLQPRFRVQWSSAGLPSRYTQTAPISTLT